MIVAPRFTHADATRASDEWGCNCGPSALAAIMHLTLDEVRPHMGDFESKRYTNPTLMFDALESLRAKWRTARLAGTAGGTSTEGWPYYGLARIQWEGPWTNPGVPMRVRYRHTHWVGVAGRKGDIGVFDINCINNGTGWVSLKEWSEIVVPYLLAEVEPKANGKWHITHAIEVLLPP